MGRRRARKTRFVHTRTINPKRIQENPNESERIRAVAAPRWRSRRQVVAPADGRPAPRPAICRLFLIRLRVSGRSPGLSRSLRAQAGTPTRHPGIGPCRRLRLRSLPVIWRTSPDSGSRVDHSANHQFPWRNGSTSQRLGRLEVSACASTIPHSANSPHNMGLAPAPPAIGGSAADSPGPILSGSAPSPPAKTPGGLLPSVPPSAPQGQLHRPPFGPPARGPRGGPWDVRFPRFSRDFPNPRLSPRPPGGQGGHK
jgi:hypothetical protein